MSDLIDRKALMKEFSDFVRESNNSDFVPAPIWNDAVSLVGSMPSAERKGEWVYLYDGNYKCSECGAWWICEETPANSGMYFCPNCGARMEGEEE